VPFKPKICGLFEALSANVSVPASLPTIDGLKVRLTVHVPPFAATGVLVEQVVPPAATAKSLPLVPPIVIEVIVTGWPVAFVSVTVCGALVVLTVCGENVRLAGERVAPAAV
jgi:hypothetical protein